ncbi:MAG: hypothetical protein ABIO70_25625 [Pseudomonadota bacterium]
MNASHLALSLCTLLAAGCHCNEPVVTDDTSGPDVPDRDRGQWTSMGVLADGTPVASYFDRSEDGLGVAFGHIRPGGTSWTYEEVDGFKDADGLDTGDRGTYTSLVVGPDDVVWVAYYDIGNKSLRYARRQFTMRADPMPTPAYEWEVGVADTGGGARPDAGRWASMALDPAGNPVIAHYDAGKGQLRVVRWADGAFGSPVVIEGEEKPAGDTGGEATPADVGTYADLAIAPDGTEYIAFYDAAWSRLLLAVGGASGYTVSTVDEEGEVGQWPSIHVGEAGAVRIAYHDMGNQDLKFAAGTPGHFETHVVDDGPYVGADTELFQNGDMLSILYFDGQNDDLKLATLAAGNWTSSTIAGNDGTGLGFHNNVIVSNGTFYAGCYDYTNRSLWLGAIP